MAPKGEGEVMVLSLEDARKRGLFQILAGRTDKLTLPEVRNEGFNTMLRNTLRKKGVDYVWQFLKLTERETEGIRQYGRKTHKRVREYFARLGLSFGMALAPDLEHKLRRATIDPPTPTGTEDGEEDGTWPKNCPQRAFVEGTKWIKHHPDRCNMTTADARDEAIRRFGDPLDPEP